MAAGESVPACKPSSGGRIRLPAPKNIENNVRPTTRACLFESVVFPIASPLVRSMIIVILYQSGARRPARKWGAPQEERPCGLDAR